MRYTLRHAFAAAAALSLLLICNRAGFADDAGGAAVKVKYVDGNTQVDVLSNGTKLFTDDKISIEGLPDGVLGLKFTRRAYKHASDAAIDLPSGSTAYVIISGRASNSRLALASYGWEKICESDLGPTGKAYFWVYKKAATSRLTMTIPASGWIGVVVAAKNLVVDSDSNAGGATTASPTPSTPRPGRPVRGGDTSGPATRPAMAQTSIKSLEIEETDSGMMLGQTSDVVMTLTPSDRPRSPEVDFATRVGEQMNLTRDDVLRYIRLKYPSWYVEKAEITFEDKYVEHDGGSIGAAIGTMLLSCIQGFQIDENAAITGDISADGKIRAIGGVSAKIRGATASKCTLVAIPNENLDQLVDAVTYSGPATVTDIQVIGIADLNDAVATVREDRDPKLTQAIALFADIQKSLKATPEYLKGKEIQAKLQKVLDLAPNHLSAQVLLSVAQGKQPKTLSAAASQYYAVLAVRSILNILNQRADSNAARAVPSTTVRMGLAALHKLRPMADPSSRILIDDWVKFVEALNALQEGGGSVEYLEEQRQSLLDEMARENADVNLMQKMLKEGM